MIDASDCGGRLGPYSEDAKPDLRNVGVYSIACDPGDIIFAVSDGVHDNLDPQVNRLLIAAHSLLQSLGKTPRDLGLGTDTWEESQRVDPLSTASVKDQFRLKFIKRLIGNELNPQIKCKEITVKLIEYCKHITRKSKKWMEDNPNKKLPVDYVTFPGKLDHTTCLSFVVGNIRLDGSVSFEQGDEQFAKPLPTTPKKSPRTTPTSDVVSLEEEMGMRTPFGLLRNAEAQNGTLQPSTQAQGEIFTHKRQGSSEGSQPERTHTCQPSGGTPAPAPTPARSQIEELNQMDIVIASPYTDAE
jgi:hypothetical protein